MPFQPILPTWLALNSANDVSPSYFSDLRTGQSILAGGLNEGDYFDLTEKEAASLSNTAVGLLHAGRYRRIQLDSSATAANVKTGAIGLLSTNAIIGGIAAPPGSISVRENLVTSYDKGIATGVVLCRPVVFLNAITPGNYGFIQELGVAGILTKNPITNGAPVQGDFLNAVATGLADDPAAPTTETDLTLGIALTNPASNQIVLVQLGAKFTVVQG